MSVHFWLVALRVANAQAAPGPAVSTDALAMPGSREPYATAVRLVDGLFVDPPRIDGAEMLRGAAAELADEIDWLRVVPDGSGVQLRHGNGAVIGKVEAHGTTDLPDALAKLEHLVIQSGYDLDDVDVQLGVLTGMASTLDPYSRILANERLDRFEVRLSGTQVGIGATFGWDDDRLLVEQISDGGPAADGGLQIGDQITRIDGRSTVSMPLSTAATKVRGEAGTQVTLSVTRAGAARTLALTRAEVVVPNVTHEVLAGNVGYVYIDHVSQRTVDNLKSALEQLQAAGALEHGLLVDLRGNTGGSMRESANAADLFLTEGLLLRTVGRDGGRVKNLQAEMLAAPDGTEPDIPIVVLVDDRTASGSEILAGALLELEWAALVGSRTYGKGTVQMIYNLGPELRFKLTVARYLLANDRAISGVEPGGPDDGIVPDVVVGRVDVEPGLVRFTDWTDADMPGDWDRVVPDVHVGDADAKVDLAVEIARRAVLQTEGSDRADVLGSVVREAEVERLDQVEHLQQLMAARNVDWAPAPAAAGRPDGDVVLRSVRSDGDTWTLTATVTNKSTAPLFRSLVQISCPTAGWWDGLVLPVGRIEPGQTVSRSVPVEVPLGVEARVDEVHVALRAERRPPLALGAAMLESGSSPRPVARVQARLVPQAGVKGPHGEPVHRAEITLENLSRTPIPGLEVRFGFPEDDAVELLDAEARVAELAGRSTQTVNLSMELAADAPAVVPLELRITSEKFGDLADWPVRLPVGGATVNLQAPAIEVRPAVRSAPIGEFSLPVQVLDDGRVDHAVVTVNGQKVTWAPGSAGRLDLVAAFDLVPGENRIVVRAEDDQGIGASRRVTVWGEVPADAVDASP